ncbi:hypothetical protein GCM10010313_37630 [Streptomyces violarus]|nr:hypothetical protein GCM10010313_37630 [Streptomyces violarus]
MNAAAESRNATSRGHRNAPLTLEGRLRLCLRIDAGRPIAHVAAEAGISRRCLAKWYARRRAHGENGTTGSRGSPMRGATASFASSIHVEAHTRSHPNAISRGPIAGSRRSSSGFRVLSR